MILTAIFDRDHLPNRYYLDHFEENNAPSILVDRGQHYDALKRYVRWLYYHRDCDSNFGGDDAPPIQSNQSDCDDSGLDMVDGPSDSIPFIFIKKKKMQKIINVF